MITLFCTSGNNDPHFTTQAESLFGMQIDIHLLKRCRHETWTRKWISDFVAAIAKGVKGSSATSQNLSASPPVLALQFNWRTNISLPERFQWQLAG